MLARPFCGDTPQPRYDSIGHQYARLRREDPRLRALIHGALGAARTIVNVGAGTGSYEPRDRHVIAIEPSDVMAAQRPRELAPAIRASAGELPLLQAHVADPGLLARATPAAFPGVPLWYESLADDLQ